MPVEDEAAFLVVPHTSSQHDIPSTPDPIPKPIVVTDMWIELCLHRKRYVHPQANITNSPFRYPVPGMFDPYSLLILLTRTGFDLLSICCTAFEGIDLLQASKVIKLMGMCLRNSCLPKAHTDLKVLLMTNILRKTSQYLSVMTSHLVGTKYVMPWSGAYLQ